MARFANELANLGEKSLTAGYSLCSKECAIVTPSKADILKAGLSALYYSRAHRLLAPYAQGLGLIFTLHQVCAPPVRDFAPNRILQVTPEFLDAVCRQVREQGFDVVRLDAARERILAGDSERPFVCFTLDDGYRDNRENAWPIFKKYGYPFTIYVPTDFPSGRGELWWLALEEVIATNERIEAELDEGREMYATRTTPQKQATFNRIYWWLRKVDEDRQRAFIRDLCERYGVDLEALCRELIMSWDELRDLARDPLVAIAGHTAGHFALAKLPLERARRQLEEGADRLESELGRRPRHYSYPYGDPGSAGAREFTLAAELGFKTGVTTRKGVLFSEHRDHLMALPRVSLNGEYQSLKYTELYLSGAPFALWNRFHKLSVA